MNEPQDSTLREAYRAMTRQRAGSRAGCVSAEDLLGVAEGTLAESDRLRVLRHVGSCDRCRHELEMLRTAAEAATSAARPMWMSRPVLAAAAGLVLLLGGVALWQRGTGLDMDIPRAGAAVVPVLLAPRADSAVVRPVRLVWSAVAAARRYRVEVLDTDGSAVYASSTVDTVAEVPATVPLAPDVVYRYWVRALLADGTEARSEFRRFQVTNP